MTTTFITKIQLATLFVFVFCGMTSRAFSQTVTYTLTNETPLLDANFYLGQPVDGSDVQGRGILQGAVSNDGRRIAFLVFNIDTCQGILSECQTSLFLVDVGDPSSWRRLSADREFVQGPLYWSPNNREIYWREFRIPVANGQYDSHTIHGYTTFDPSPTLLRRNNWVASNLGLFDDVVLLPITANGNQDNSRQPVIVTNMAPAVYISWPSIAGDGNALTFSSYVPSTPVNLSDVYVLKNLQQIMDAPKIPGTDISSLAPISLTDPNIVPIRTVGSNFAHTMTFSEDSSLVIFSEDWNNVFHTLDYFNTGSMGNFDIMISNADGSGPLFRFDLPENQATVKLFPGGLRATYIKQDGGPYDVHLFAVSLEASTQILGTASGDNDITALTDQVALDGSGTKVNIATGTLIDFPSAAPQTITISTPLIQVPDSQLPAGVSKIPVVRTFGQNGTTFTPKAQITIAYTDAEIYKLNESTIIPYLQNDISGNFDQAVLPADIIEHNLEENYITFQVDIFPRMV